MHDKSNSALNDITLWIYERNKVGNQGLLALVKAMNEIISLCSIDIEIKDEGNDIN